MIARPFWQQRLKWAWGRAPIAWLAGVRRVGKTTLAKTLPVGETTYLNCDRPQAAELLKDPEVYLRQVATRHLVLDEVHQLPDPARVLKVAADEFPKLRLLATGSSTVAASRRFRDTLTGRKRVVVLRPVLFSELPAFGMARIEDRLLRGGLPPALLADEPLEDFYAEWLDSHFSRDVQELFPVGKRDGYLGLLQLLFRQSGGLLDATRLARDLGLSRPTVLSYLEIAGVTLTIHLLRPYHAGNAREWTHQPKAYAFDTGLVCHARGWDRLRPEDCGQLWEHLVLDTLLSLHDPERVRFWRSHAQREVDFVVPRHRDEVDAYECQWQALEPDVSGLKAFRRAYPKGRNFIVTPAVNAPVALRRDELEFHLVNPSHLMAAAA